MFISTRRLRKIGLAIVVAVGGWLGLQLAAEPLVNRTVPVWMAIEPGPMLTYIDGYEEGPPGATLRAGAAILVEANTGTILYAHNEHDRRPMASTTKIMTALMALENTPLDELVTVSAQAVRVTGSDAGLRAGQQLTMFELLHALMLPSGNDAANVIAEHVAGSQADFAELMNERAYELGALRTALCQRPRPGRSEPLLHRARFGHFVGDGHALSDVQSSCAHTTISSAND